MSALAAASLTSARRQVKAAPHLRLVVSEDESMRVNPSTLFLVDEVDEAEGSVADGPGPDVSEQTLPQRPQGAALTLRSGTAAWCQWTVAARLPRSCLAGDAAARDVRSCPAVRTALAPSPNAWVGLSAAQTARNADLGHGVHLAHVSVPAAQPVCWNCHARADPLCRCARDCRLGNSPGCGAGIHCDLAPSRALRARNPRWI